MCRFYPGFNDDHCLKMQAPRFFLLFEQIERVRGKEYADECYVSRSATLSSDAFNVTRNEFFNRGEKRERPQDLDLQSYVEAPALKTEDAKDAVMGMFANDPKINRKVLVNPIVNPHPRRRH